MAITDLQRRTATEFLEKRLTHPCPVCALRNFTIADIINTSPADPSGAFVLGPSIPLLLVMCTNCFHTLTFAAVPMQLMAEASPPTEGEVP